MVKRDQQILDAAERLFFERSFDGVGVDAIGKEAGVTGSAIYRHFEGKDEILSVLFGEAIDTLLQKVGEPEDDPRAELEHLVTAHVEFAVSHPRLAGIWAREQRALAEQYQRAIRRRQRRYIDRWVRCLDDCFPGHMREELLAVIRAVHALITSDAARPPGTKPVPGLATLLVGLTLGGLDTLATSRAR